MIPASDWPTFCSESVLARRARDGALMPVVAFSDRAFGVLASIRKSDDTSGAASGVSYVVLF